MHGLATWVCHINSLFIGFHSHQTDRGIWVDPEIFDPTRWLEHPDAPLFTYGVGSRSCSGVSLANRFLYLFFLRLISAFEIRKGSQVDVDPVRGVKSAADLVSSPNRYTVQFCPRDQVLLSREIGK